MDKTEPTQSKSTKPIKAWLDKQTAKLVSKKLSVFIVACVFVALGSITGADWVDVAMAYIGSQGLVDAASHFKHQGEPHV
jgi:hypothetical protein